MTVDIVLVDSVDSVGIVAVEVEVALVDDIVVVDIVAVVVAFAVLTIASNSC